MPIPADPAVLAFVAIPAVLVLLLTAGVVRAYTRIGRPRAEAWARGCGVLAVAAAWMGVSWSAADQGLLARWDTIPPPFAGVVAVVFLLAALLGLTPLGRVLARETPLWLLVAVQGFRLPLELAMHEMGVRGVMPSQMSYSGWNFDILTGVSALAVALAVRFGFAGRRLVAIWNVVGSVLLAAIIVIAIASTPTFAAFGAERLNTWVASPPFVWLPAIMVLAALAGHILVYRALRPPVV